MSNMELEALVVFLFGPITGVVCSVMFSGMAERVIQARKPTRGLHAGAIAAGIYAVALGFLFAVTRPYLASLLGPLMWVGFALFITGMPYVGLPPLVAWSLLAGLVHGTWRPQLQATSN